MARELRIKVRQRLQAGDSDEAVISSITKRYGTNVLIDPSFNRNTYLLWLAPLLLLTIGGLLSYRLFRRN